MTCAHLESPNPRAVGTCVKCGHTVPSLRPRDHDLERYLIELVVKEAGFNHAGGLDSLANHRAHPGGVRTELNPDQEAREELADCCNYLLWGCEPLWERYMAGDADAAEVVARRLGALRYVLQAWLALGGHGT